MVTIDEHLSQQAPDADVDAMRQLGIDVVSECRNALMLRFRYLDAALWRMPLDPSAEVYCLLTDGKKLSFGPKATALRYRSDPNEVTREVLHTVLHCVFRQPFESRYDNGWVFSLACDVMIENLAMDMCGQRFPSKLDDRRREFLEGLMCDCPSLAPNKLYRYICDNVDDEGLCEIASLFQRDSHMLWACMKDRQDRPDDEHAREKRDRPSDPNPGAEPSETPSDELSPEQPDTPVPLDGPETFDADGQPEEGDDGDASEGSESSGQSGEDGSDDARNEEGDDGDAPNEGGGPAGDGAQSEEDGDDAPEQAEDGDDAPEGDEAELSDDEQAWEDIARQIEVDLQTRSLSWNSETGTLSKMLSVANRQTYDYADFLRRFATLSEEMKLNDDEFDYIYYTFGMDRYGDMPLIEPLEYKDTNRIREFVIAIDTSSSCEGALVRTFVQRTYDILKDTESFQDTVNIHIVQCDAEVKSDTKICSVEELDEYLGCFELFGFGGTDFRPVFEYVDELLDAREFENLRGLVYFTDGLGDYPEHQPDYDTVFVFLNEEQATVKVPPWAMKVILDEDGVENL